MNFNIKSFILFIVFILVFIAINAGASNDCIAKFPAIVGFCWLALMFLSLLISLLFFFLLPTLVILSKFSY